MAREWYWLPGSFGTDLYLSQFAVWLGASGIKPFYSDIPINADARTC